MSTNESSLDQAFETVLVWLKDIQKELGIDSLENTYSATKTVLQAIRDRLPVEEVIHLSANLPLVMKGMLRGVVCVLNRRMGGGEMRKVAAIMPLEIKMLCKQAGVEVTDIKKCTSSRLNNGLATFYRLFFRGDSQLRIQEFLGFFCRHVNAL